MPITNGYDSQEVLDVLFGRLKWRSLNSGTTFPKNSTYELPRANYFITVGVTAGLSVGGTSYVDSSLTGWTFQVLNPDGSQFLCTLNSNGFTLLSGAFIAGTVYVLTFTPQVKIPKSSFSGRYFEQFHPIVTTTNLASVIDQTVATGAAFNNFLSDLEQGMILTLLNGVFNEPQMIEDQLIYDRRLRVDLPWTNSNKFCGYRLYIAPGEFAARIVEVSFLMNGVANFNLYLYQDVQAAPIYQIPVTTIANQEVLVALPDWVIHYMQQQTSQGGVFYLGYYQYDLGGVQALDQFVSQWSRSYAYGYTAFETPQTVFTPGAYDFFRKFIPYTFVTYGMNVRIETYRDFTARIVKNPSLFDHAMGLAMAVVCLGYQAYNVRTNFVQRQLENYSMILYGEINNSADAKDHNPYIAGLKVQLHAEMRKINDNFFKRPGVIATRPPIMEGNNLQGVFP